MGHITSKNYIKLQKRLNDAAQGAPASEDLFKILKFMFTEEEAELVSVLPLNMFSAETVSKIWRKELEETEKILNSLTGKNILLDFESKDKKLKAFILTPPMAGFFEFAMMRADGKYDHKILSELLYNYVNKNDYYIEKALSIEPAIFRTYVQESAIQEKDKTMVLDYEKASHIINTASCITVSLCHCRHKMEHLGKACDMPQEVCMTFNKAAESLVRHKIARQISRKEAMDTLEKCTKLGLVQIGDNVQGEVDWICNCCSCCCDALGAYKKLGYNPNISTNFLAKHLPEKCLQCGECLKRCPVDAIKFKKSRESEYEIKINLDRCIGCGVCTRFCPAGALILERRKKINFTPKDSFERFALSAIETGKLQNFIFDNYSLWTHALMRKFIGVILKLPPSKKLLAQKQIRSKFMNTLARTKHYKLFNKIFNDGEKADYNHYELGATSGSR